MTAEFDAKPKRYKNYRLELKTIAFAYTWHKTTRSFLNHDKTFKGVIYAFNGQTVKDVRSLGHGKFSFKFLPP